MPEGRGAKRSHFHCLVINWQSTAQTSPITVSNLRAVFYPLVACVICCLNQITRRCVNYRLLLHTIMPKLALLWTIRAVTPRPEVEG